MIYNKILIVICTLSILSCKTNNSKEIAKDDGFVKNKLESKPILINKNINGFDREIKNKIKGKWKTFSIRNFNHEKEKGKLPEMDSNVFILEILDSTLKFNGGNEFFFDIYTSNIHIYIDSSEIDKIPYSIQKLKVINLKNNFMLLRKQNSKNEYVNFSFNKIINDDSYK